MAGALFFLLPSLVLGQEADKKGGQAVVQDSPEALYKEGEKLRLQGEFDRAVEAYSKCLEISRKSGDTIYKLDSQLKLGLVYWNIGSLKESTAYYANALSLAKKLADKNREELAAACLDIHRLYEEGMSVGSSDNPQKAIESFQKAIDTARKINNPDHEPKCLRELSFIYWDQNNLGDFFSLSSRALKISVSIKNKREEMKCLNSIGTYYWKIDDYASALNAYERALEIAEFRKDIMGQAAILHNIGLVWIYLGNYDKALDSLTKAYNLDQTLSSKANLALDLNTLGMALIRKGRFSDNESDFSRAEAYLKNSLKTATETKDKAVEAWVLNNLGSLSSQRRRYSDSLEYFNLALKKAEEINNIRLLGNIYNNIGIVYANEGNYDLSTEYYEKAIKLALGIKGGEILWESYLEIANSLKNQKKYDEAIENYINSIKIIEEIRFNLVQEELKAGYLGADKRMDAYQNLIDLLAALYISRGEKKYAIEAFNYLEKAKARAFLDSLEISQIQVSQGADFKLVNEEKEIMREVSQLYTKLLIPSLNPEEKARIDEQLKIDDEKLETLKRGIRTTSPAYAELKYPEVITFEEAQANIADGETVFMAYSLGKDRSFGFALRKDDFKIFPAPARKVIQEQVAEYRKIISDKDNRDFQLGRLLFEELVQPGLSREVKRIIFIPDDILHLLPFETLVPDGKKERWLIQDYAVSYVPSLSSLRSLKTRSDAFREKPHKDLLAFGDPFYGANEENRQKQSADLVQDFAAAPSINFYRLKYSGLEIRKIAALFRSSKRDVFQREEATEDRLKSESLKDYRIVHFATHGLIDDKKPARSSIILALDQDPAEDGLLQMREIFNLKMNADLVVLSACQTGLGQFIRGEGIEGLSRAFFYAGTSSVLMSLWAINDEATYQLMERFYRHLKSRQSPMNALRRAKLEMINSRVLSHPYYWASFIISGKTDKAVFPVWIGKWIILAVVLGTGAAVLFILRKRSREKR